MATPRVAAGALFFDDEGRVLLVKPAYKQHWDIPGGYVEPGESPLAACVREVREELGLLTMISRLLVVDWAPADGEGDKILFVFDGGRLADVDHGRIAFRDGELSESQFVSSDQLDGYVPARLSRRIRTGIEARKSSLPVYAEHGGEPLSSRPSQDRT